MGGMAAAAQEIFSMVKEEIIKSGYFELQPGGMVLTGGGALLPGTIDLAEKTLGMPVRLGLPRDIGGLKDTVHSPMHATAVGLVMYAAKHQLTLREQEKNATLKQGWKNIFNWLRRHG
jgi:cell division protein FtsA